MTGPGGAGQVIHLADPDTLALVRAARKNREARERLLQRIIPRVQRTVGFLVRGDAEGQDLVNTCMVEILEALDGYKGTGSVEAWAQGITYRVAMRHLKRRRRRERTVLLDELLDLNPGGSAEQELETRSLWQRLQVHLMRLPEERRLTFVLRVVHEHSVGEVAQITGVPVNTARDRIRVALKELRQSLTADPELMSLLGRESHD